MDTVRALLFDVFGTVVDWRGSVIRHIERIGSDYEIDLAAADLADEWRRRYGPSMQAVLDGAGEYANLDDLHRSSLRAILEERGIDLPAPAIDELVLAWHRLDPWPDALPGLSRLKRRFIIGTMSNGNVALLVGMAKYGGLPWDVILTPELMRTYKKNLASYEYAIELLGLHPGQTMMVAAHAGELAAVTGLGMHTAYVPRPSEFGHYDPSVLDPGVDVDVIATDLEDLAARLGV